MSVLMKMFCGKDETVISRSVSKLHETSFIYMLLWNISPQSNPDVAPLLLHHILWQYVEGGGK
jgi:hypothetical protein